MGPKRVFLSLSSPLSSTPLDTLLATSTPHSLLFSLASDLPLQEKSLGPIISNSLSVCYSLPLLLLQALVILLHSEGSSAGRAGPLLSSP